MMELTHLLGLERHSFTRKHSLNNWELRQPSRNWRGQTQKPLANLKFPHLLPPPVTYKSTNQNPRKHNLPPFFSIHHLRNHKKIKPIYHSKSTHTINTFNTTTNSPIKLTNSKSVAAPLRLKKKKKNYI